MDFIDHIRRCNRWDPSGFLPFRVLGQTIGWVRPSFATLLSRFPACFEVEGDAVDLAAGLSTAAERTAAMRLVVQTLTTEGLLPAPHGEDYAVVRRWGDEAVFLLDRRVVPAFGLRAFGVHVNGFVREQASLKLWIGRRAADKSVEPGKLDNMVAGGLPAGMSPRDNVVKEAAEEAGLAPALARTARPVGVVTYCMEDAVGLKPDTMFVYDLEVPPGLTPRNTDGEIAEFMLMDVDTVAGLVRSGTTFKFNVALVLIDFLVRHGWVSAESQPDYLDLVAGLRATLPT